MTPQEILSMLQARAVDTARPEHWLLAMSEPALRDTLLGLGAARRRIEQAGRPRLLAALWRRTAWRLFQTDERALALKWGGTFRSAVYIEMRATGAPAVYADLVYPPDPSEPAPRLIVACGLRRERRKEASPCR